MWDKKDGERASRDNGGRVSARALASAAPPLTYAGLVHRTWGRRPRRRRQASERRWGEEEMGARVFPRSRPRLYTVRFRRGESAPSIWRSTVSNGWRISGLEVAHAGRGARPIRRPSRRLSDYSPGGRVASRPRDAFCCCKWLAMNSSVSQLVMRISEAILSKFECFHLNVKFKSLFKL
jgi:hypothetical protein